MSASMKIDQAGLSAGDASRSRDDGLATGALVTLTSVGHISTFRFNLLWVGQHPSPDTTSVSSLAQASATTYTFSPTAGVYGTWRIELITDEGSRFEGREIRTFAIKESASAIRIPAANEQSNSAANLTNSSDYVSTSENNKIESTGAFVSGTYVSYWKSIADTVYSVNTLSSSVNAVSSSVAAISGSVGSMIPTAIQAGPTYEVQPGTYVPLDPSGGHITASLANGVNAGDRCGVVFYYSGGSPPSNKVIIDPGSNISTSMFDVAHRYLQYDSGELKSVVFVWSGVDSFWCMESATTWTSRL